MGDRLRPLWDFNDLDGTEACLREQLKQETSDGGRAEVLTQLARVEGLREGFAEGERILQEAERIAGESKPARIRIDLERGRLRRSAGDPGGARPLFVSAFERASAENEQFMAVDAAHMCALAAPDRQSMLDWTQRGIDIARASSDRDVTYWLGPLYNNLGVDHAEAGEHEAALDAFQRALEARLRYPENPQAIQWAKESVAEALKALGRDEEAEGSSRRRT
jgi:tetratricopeptide (TPR) repeat protein